MSSMSAFRGGYAPRRGRGRGGWKQSSFSRPKKRGVEPDLVKNPLGELLETVSIPRLQIVDPAAHGSISDVKYIASYNWHTDAVPTILVPGKPPQWTPPQKAQQLSEDSGQYYRDVNAARYPEYPLAPVIQSVLALEPTFPSADIDIVACGSTVGNLLRLVRGQDKIFRFTVEVIGDTVFFGRKENDPREIIPDVRGYGHSFPEAYTTWENDVKGSETHQRIVRYKLGKFACLVRFECDGYLNGSSLSGGGRTNKGRSLDIEDGADLTSALEKSKITVLPSTQNVTSDGIKVVRSGAEVSQDLIFDLKTRSGRFKTDIDMSDIYPQLWIKQIPNFIVAYHDGAGLFEDNNVKVRDVRSDVAGWEKENAVAIRRLGVLLEKIVTWARNDGGLLEVYSPGPNLLELRKQYGDGVHALPESLRYAWTGEEDRDDDSADLDVGGVKLGKHDSGNEWNSDSDEELDYTACSVECGYCGRCTY
ncbi:hypothetical protein DE146DRAFT_147938 [Phaeosphaeria sp. MPI-PUGE-AT-0046c]|nr:hypothetical protein DE146DRAFT_147938 [Phaeosphaeria sp. MPI-PUGE-AT-0046c]